jgi:hypothetical protein
MAEDMSHKGLRGLLREDVTSQQLKDLESLQ